MQTLKKLLQRKGNGDSLRKNKFKIERGQDCPKNAGSEMDRCAWRLIRVLGANRICEQEITRAQITEL